MNVNIIPQETQEHSSGFSETPSDVSLSKNEKATQQRWSDEEEKRLIQLWSEHFTRLESRHSRVVWEEIAQGVGKSVPQCKRKIQYLKDKYKEAKDHNRNQSSGERKTSPFYDDLDAVLGCRDVVTLKHVVASSTKQSSTSSSSTSSSSSSSEDSSLPNKLKNVKRSNKSSSLDEEREECGDDDKGKEEEDEDSDDIFKFPKSAIKKRGRRERKKSKRRAIPVDDVDNDEQESGFDKQLNVLEKQGDKLNNVLESMEKNQSQQLQMMDKFMNNMMQLMQSKNNNNGQQ